VCLALALATFNTLNKWALGIGDTLAARILCEYLGDDNPIVAALPQGALSLTSYLSQERSHGEEMGGV